MAIIFVLHSAHYLIEVYLIRDDTIRYQLRTYEQEQCTIDFYNVTVVTINDVSMQWAEKVGYPSFSSAGKKIIASNFPKKSSRHSKCALFKRERDDHDFSFIISHLLYWIFSDD
jgi:hypothetical protein